MCTRYYVEMSTQLRPYVEAAGHSALKDKMVSRLGRPFKGSGEIRPADMAAVIAPDRMGKRAVFPMIWGYHIPGLDRPVVNARSESASYRKSFEQDWQKHRCIIPASYYFEWKHFKNPDGRTKTGDKFAIQPRGLEVTYLAGLYRIENTRGFRYPVFVVLTRAPGENVAKIHDRMPLILPPSAIDAWISPDRNPEETMQTALTDMITEKSE